MGRNVGDFNAGRGFVDPDPHLEDAGEDIDWMQTLITSPEKP